MESKPESKVKNGGNESKSLKVDYTSFEDLPPYDEKESLLEVMRNVSTALLKINEKEWKDNFNLLNELRRLLKHQKELFFTVFNNYKVHQKILPELINSLRSNLAKNALTLVSEIFNCYETESVNEWIGALLPDVLVKSALDLKSFIKEEATKCLKNFAENMFYGESIVELLKGIKHQNSKVSENAFETLMKLIQNFDKVALENMESWKQVLTGIIEVYQMKKDPYVKRPYRILSALKEKIGNEILESKIKENMKESNQKLIETIMNNKPRGMNSKSAANRSSSNTSLRQRIKEFNKEKPISEKKEILVVLKEEKKNSEVVEKIESNEENQVIQNQLEENGNKSHIEGTSDGMLIDNDKPDKIN